MLSSGDYCDDAYVDMHIWVTPCQFESFMCIISREDKNIIHYLFMTISLWEPSFKLALTLISIEM